MPVLLSEEEVPAGIFEKVAKDPSSKSDSTASEHERHENEHTPGNHAQNILQQQQQQQSKVGGGGTGPGPIIPQSDGEDLPPKASKEELKARSEELNK